MHPHRSAGADPERAPSDGHHRRRPIRRRYGCSGGRRHSRRCTVQGRSTAGRSQRSACKQNIVGGSGHLLATGPLPGHLPAGAGCTVCAHLNRLTCMPVRGRVQDASKVAAALSPCRIKMFSRLSQQLSCTRFYKQQVKTSRVYCGWRTIKGSCALPWVSCVCCWHASMWDPSSRTGCCT